MSRIPLVGLTLLLALIASACTILTGPSTVAQWENQAFYGLDRDNILMEIDEHGGHYASEDIGEAHNLSLSRAWEAGEAPAAPLIGRDPAMWIRSLDATLNPDGSLHLLAKALAPYPIRFSLTTMEGGQERLLGQLFGSAWSTGTHFAKVEVDYRLASPQATLILRIEGINQTMESVLHLQVKAAPAAAQPAAM